MAHRIGMVVLSAVLPLASLAQEAALETDVQRFSYAVGLQIGQNLRQQGIPKVDAAAMALAIDDVMNSRDLRLTVDEMRAAQQGYRTAMLAERGAMAETNKQNGETFLTENRGRDGISELESGVQYRIIEAGTGEKPTETDKVTVHYRGRLLDGTVFDSSYERGEPAVLELTQVIPGWQEALRNMPVGSTWEVWIPHALAYGENGAGGAIGPNETLNFQIELISIEGG